MKKVFSTLFLSVLLASSTMVFSSCNKGSSKIHLDFGSIHSQDISNITDLPELKYNNLLSKISHGDSFLLAIYNEGCGCWTDFQPVLTEFYNKTHCNVEYINVYEFTGKDDLGLYLVPADLPSLAVYENGQLKIQQVYLRDDRMMFKSYSNFKEFIDKNTVLPKMYYVEKDVLDSYIAENKEFNLYVARRECGDCNAVTTEVLYDWNKNVETVNNLLYVFDIQDYYPINPGEDATEEQKQKYQEDLVIYQDIKDTYGLSEKNNPVLGYDANGAKGMVPTFQRRKGSQIKDMMVVLNDYVDRENSKVKSYFTSTRVGQMSFLKDAKIKTILDGMELTSDQVTNWRSYKHEYYMNYHYPIVKLFLDTYVK